MRYLNIGNEKFTRRVNSRIYVDKSDLIRLLNQQILTDECNICISRPRRFGKSVTAYMLAAYYSRDCDSSNLFDNLKIAESSDYKNHLNSYDTIFINITDAYNSSNQDVNKMIEWLTLHISDELKKKYPDVEYSDKKVLYSVFEDVYNFSKVPFVFIIDEWDCIMREKKEDTESLKIFLEWIKTLFKDKTYVALSFMTGILPIKKYGTQSALNMFKEYSMTDQGKYAPFISFTEDEVKTLCDNHNADFLSMKKWYDGYSFGNISHIYNPNSVVNSIDDGVFKSYWTKTESFESLVKYIDMNFDGLKEDIVKLIAGEEIVVSTASYTNDMATFNNKDDVLTLLIHLGYLCINPNPNRVMFTDMDYSVRIPNEEIRYEFRNVIRCVKTFEPAYRFMLKTQELLNNIWSLNEEKVALAFDEAHQDNTSILTYNDENSLACVVRLALYLSSDIYTVVRELPTGKGFADVVYLPKNGVDKPAILVELKYDKDAQSAISQIREKNYTNFFKDYKGDVLLVGINYDKQSKAHQCQIEKFNNQK